MASVSKTNCSLWTPLIELSASVSGGLHDQRTEVPVKPDLLLDHPHLLTSFALITGGRVYEGAGRAAFT